MTCMTRISRLHSRRARVAAALTGVLTAAFTATALAATASPASAAPEVLIVGTGGNEAFLCNVADHGVRSSIWPLQQVDNGCANRVWLHTSTGGAYCFTGHRNSTVPAGAQFADDAQVSGNTAGC